MLKFEDLKGKTIIEVQGKVDDEEMIFITDDGMRAVLYYDND